MKTASNYLEVNKALWNERAKAHVTSGFYDLSAFLEGKSSLNEIELGLLGNVSNKSLLHLQCHFGQDTLSLARMGASVTGVDFSNEAISTANELALTLKLDANFVCCDIYELSTHLEGAFDLVFSSYGTIGWLPDLDRWAAVVSKYLKPGGIFVFAEFHPAYWMFDNELNYVQYSYFNREEIVETEEGSYADKDAPIKLPAITWNHSLAEVIESLLKAGLTLKEFKEFDYSPYNISPRMIEIAPGKFQVEKMEGKLPIVYALSMVKS